MTTFVPNFARHVARKEAMTDKDKKALVKLLKKVQAALLDPRPDEGGKLTKALDKAIAKLEKA